jgi:hypothetical protein
MRILRWVVVVGAAAATLGVDLAASLDAGQPSMRAAEAKRKRHKKHARRKKTNPPPATAQNPEF